MITEWTARRRVLDVLTAIAVAVLTMAATVLVREQRQVRHDHSVTAPAVLKGGAPAIDIHGRAVDGRPVVIALRQQTTPLLIYAFSSRCLWCERNVENINVLAASVVQTHRVIGLCLDRDEELVRSATGKYAFETIWDISRETRSAYRLNGTPLTIRVLGQSVTHVWPGAFSEHGDVTEFFGVKLPGVSH